MKRVALSLLLLTACGSSGATGDGSGSSGAGGGSGAAGAGGGVGAGQGGGGANVGGSGGGQAGQSGAGGAAGGPGGGGAGAAGLGGNGGGAGAAGGGGVGGNCVEIRIGDPQSAIGYTALPANEFLGIAGAIRVLFDGKSAGSSGAFAETFSPSTGANLSLQTLSVPDGNVVGWDNVPTYGAAWSPAGVFAVGAPSGVYLGSEMSSQLALTKFVDPQVWSVYSVLWDGDAFAVHMNQTKGPACPLAVSRVAVDGTLMSPPVTYGDSCGSGVSAGHQAIAADAASGHTYVVDAAFSISVNGHDKAGIALWGGPKGAPTVKDAYNPSISADADGAFILTSPEPDTDFKNPHAPRVFRLGLDGSVVAVGTLPLPTGETTDFKFAASSHSAADAWFVANTDVRFYVIDVAGGQMGAPRVVIDSGLSVADLMADPTKYQPYSIKSPSPPMTYEADGRKWLAYEDDTLSGGVVLRILRVDDPSCTYPALNPWKGP